MHIYNKLEKCANNNIFIKSRVGLNWYRLLRNFLFRTMVLYMSTIHVTHAEFSSSDLEKLEKEFIQLINQSDDVIRNPLSVQYINHLGRNLARHADLRRYYFFLVNSDEINAFAGPGGYIGINSRLILATETESELAGVMSHELSHVALSHLYRMIEHQKNMRIPMLASALAAIALGAINPTLGSGALMAALTGYAQENINYTRANEKQADRIGIDILHKAGFNPNGMANFFKKMQQNDRYYYTAHIPAILRTHPLDQGRIAEAENRTTQLPVKNYKNSSKEYLLFKEQIRVLTEKKPIALLDYYQHALKRDGFKEHLYYGYGLALSKTSQNKHALKLLSYLTEQDPDNLHYQIALSQVEFNLKNYKSAIKRLYEMSLNYPDNYAAILSYADGLIISNQFAKAANYMRKAKLIFPNDLPLCYKLARSYAGSKQFSDAYFTQAQCLMMQGMKKSALEQLKHAKKINEKNKLLAHRINALINDLKK